MENLQLVLMKAAMCGGVFCAVVIAVILLWRQLVAIGRVLHALPAWERVLVVLLVATLISYGGSKTNLMQGVQHPMMMLRTVVEPPSVTVADIDRGWRAWEARTNADWSATMPEGAALCSNWWVRGAFDDCSIVRLGDCSFAGGVSQSNNLNNPNNQTMWFPFGSNEYDSVWAFPSGKIRFRLRDTNDIAAVGAPMSAVPFHSRLWTAAGTNGARFVTWENFALNRDTNTPVNAQVELRTSGDFVTRSNGVETAYRRIEPFDWDGDGLVNELDLRPYHDDGDCFGQGEGWVRANFTNADEIAQFGGYGPGVWGKVGHDLRVG